MRPDGDPLAEGHRGEGRGAPPVPPRHRHRADHPRRACGLELPDSSSTATSRRRSPGVDEVLLRRGSDAPTAQADAVLRDARARAASGTRAGTPSPSTGRRSGIGQLRQDDAGSCSTPTRTAPRRTTSPTSTPRRSSELVDVWFVEAGKYDVLPLDDRDSARDPPRRAPVDQRCRRGRVRASTRTPPSCRSVRLPNIRGRSFKILAEVELTDADADGVLFAHGARFGGHALFVKDRQALRTSTTSSASRPSSSFVGRRCSPSARTCSASSSPRSAIGDHHEAHRHRQAVRRRPTRRRGPDAHPAGPLRALR